METLLLAQRGTSFSEFSRDPILTVACIMLIGVAVAWVVLSRMIVHLLKRAERPTPRRRSKRPARMWERPPQ